MTKYLRSLLPLLTLTLGLCWSAPATATALRYDVTSGGAALAVTTFKNGAFTTVTYALGLVGTGHLDFENGVGGGTQSLQLSGTGIQTTSSLGGSYLTDLLVQYDPPLGSYDPTTGYANTAAGPTDTSVVVGHDGDTGVLTIHGDPADLGPLAGLFHFTDMLMDVPAGALPGFHNGHPIHASFIFNNFLDEGLVASGWFVGSWGLPGTEGYTELHGDVHIGFRPPQQVPEPASLALLATGLGLAGLRRRRASE